MIGSEFVRRLKEHADFVTVCPEADIGLGVPRDPIRIVKKGEERRLMQPSTGKDVTPLMIEFRSQFLSKLDNLDGFVLKSRSPSCGVRDVRIYPEKEGGVPTYKEIGMFAEEVLRRFPDLPVEDEARLRNIKLGERFLTSVFTLASFRELEDGNMSTLIDFHSNNKLLLMMYSQKELKTLGNIVANRDGKSMQEIYNLYQQHLRSAMSRLPRCTAPVNVLMHAFGYFSGQLRKEERDFYLQTIEMYRESRVPLSVCLNLTQSYIIRFGVDYLANQTFFRPFPEGILEVGITDSCDWRELSV
jgi:uncharacterized protein YbgA (DUF1722 family)/uncharacterized protein YbbK (DUF523 family)